MSFGNPPANSLKSTLEAAGGLLGLSQNSNATQSNTTPSLFGSTNPLPNNANAIAGGIFELGLNTNTNTSNQQQRTTGTITIQSNTTTPSLFWNTNPAPNPLPNNANANAGGIFGPGASTYTNTSNQQQQGTTGTTGNLLSTNHFSQQPQQQPLLNLFSSSTSNPLFRK